MRTFPANSHRGAAEKKNIAATTFLHLIEKYLRHEEMKIRNKKMDKRYNEAQHRNDPKRVKVKDLVKDGSGVSTVEIMDEKIRALMKHGSNVIMT